VTPPRAAPRLLREGFDRYAEYAIVALVLVPMTPDIAADLATGNWPTALVRLAVIATVLALSALGLWRVRRSSERRQRLARKRMTELDRCDILVLPLSREPEYRATDREEAESVPELLIDGKGGLDPATIVLVRSPQIDNAAYTTLTTALTERRPDTELVHAVVSDVNDPELVYQEIRHTLTLPRPPHGMSLLDRIRGGESVAFDLTGGTALMTVGLAALAHDLHARCVYVSGTRGPHGRFLLNTQNRHLITVSDLFRNRP
jgi:hypothetical protein